MGTLMIRSVDERVKSGLRILAARRGVSMEQQARDILERAVLGPPQDVPFAQRIRQRFEALTIDSLPVPPRQSPRASSLQDSSPVAAEPRPTVRGRR